MDDVDLCPPWWPGIIWWLEHHPPHHGPTIPDREGFRDATEALLVGLHQLHCAVAIGPKQEDLRLQLVQVATDQMAEAVQQLSSLTQG